MENKIIFLFFHFLSHYVFMSYICVKDDFLRIYNF